MMEQILEITFCVHFCPGALQQRTLLDVTWLYSERVCLNGLHFWLAKDQTWFSSYRGFENV